MNRRCLVAVSLLPALAFGDPTPPEKWKIDVSGYVDMYYQYDTGHSISNGGVNGRWFDVNSNTFRIASAQLDISRTPTDKCPFGFWLSLYDGKSADILASTEPGGIKSYENFQQAYVTYRIAGKMPTTVDFGKWDSFVGYEVIDSRLMDNYSHSFISTGLEPAYMTGLRVTTTVNPRLTAGGYLYQGFNEVKDSNNSKSVGASLQYAFNHGFTLNLEAYDGEEGSKKANESGTYGGIGYPTPGQSSTSAGCVTVTYQANARDKFVVNADAANAHGRGKWGGIEAIYRRQLSKNTATAVRIDHAEDPFGLRFLDGALQLNSLTGTFDQRVSRNVLLRFELREDLASKAFFNSDSGLRSTRSTATIAVIVNF